MRCKKNIGVGPFRGNAEMEYSVLYSCRRDVPNPDHCNGRHWCYRRAPSFIVHILSVQARIARRRREGNVKLPEAISWFGLLAPAGTPAAVVSKVHADIVQIAVQADVRERIAQLGLEASLNSPEEFAVVIKSDTAKWAKVIRAANIKPE
jgi:hypothetical protein